MYLRALGSILCRRFSPRGIPRTRAQPQAWIQESYPGIFSRASLGATAARPARSLHTLRNLGADSASFLPAIIALVGLSGFVYLKKGTNESAAETTPVDTNKEVCDVWNPKDPAVMATFVDKNGTMNWQKYYEYLLCLWYHGGKAVEEFTDKEPTKQCDVKDETVMKERFEQWMKQYNRAYKTEEEKPMRYENFKLAAICADKYGDGKPGCFADLTEDEFESPYPGCSIDYEQVIEEVGSRITDDGSSDQKGVLDLNRKTMEMLSNQAEERNREA